MPEMPPVPQEGPLTRPGATNAGRAPFSYQPPQSGLGPGQAILIFFNSRRILYRKFWTVRLSLALAGSTPNCR